MALLNISAPRMAGIACVTPPYVEENSSLSSEFGESAMRSIVESLGIERRPVANHHQVTDLASIGIKAVLEGLSWDPESVDLLVVVTQTPQQAMPGTSYLLQARNKLSTNVAALDLSLGCSGFIYGLATISTFMESGGLKRALLVCGDLSTSMIAPNDRSLRPLFGDAIAVVGLEADSQSSGIFDLGSDGHGAEFLKSSSGGTLKPGPAQMEMDGLKVLSFALQQVPLSIQRVLVESGKNLSKVDKVVFHQANMLVLRTIAKKLGIPDEQLLLALKDWGNTGSASIPLALCQPDLTASEVPKEMLLCGFGVGWSWGSMLWTTPIPEFRCILKAP